VTCLAIVIPVVVEDLQDARLSYRKRAMLLCKQWLCNTDCNGRVKFISYNIAYRMSLQCGKKVLNLHQ